MTARHRCPTGVHRRPSAWCYDNHEGGGCRCAGCTAANSAYRRRRRARRSQQGVCPACGGPAGLYAGGTCGACYGYRLTHGRSRPRDLISPPASTPCSNCRVDVPRGAIRHGRCGACSRYLSRYGVERPARLYAKEPA